MKDVYLVGVDGSEGSKRAAAHAIVSARKMDFDLIVVFVIEWSPFTFSTAEENATRHQRREAEIETATLKVVNPLLEEIGTHGVSVKGIVRHGNTSNVMIQVATEEKALGMYVGRVGETGLSSMIFGGVTAKLVQTSPVPVTVVP